MQTSSQRNWSPPSFNSGHDESRQHNPAEPIQVTPIDTWMPAIAGVQSWTTQLARMGMEMQSEWLRFMEKRLHEDAALTQGLISCKAPDDAMRIYNAFIRTAIDDYQRELTTFTKLGSAATASTLEVMQPPQVQSPRKRSNRSAPHAGG